MENQEKKQKDTIRLLVDVPREIHLAFKAKCALEGKCIQAAVIEMIKVLVQKQ